MVASIRHGRQRPTSISIKRQKIGVKNSQRDCEGWAIDWRAGTPARLKKNCRIPPVGQSWARVSRPRLPADRRSPRALEIAERRAETPAPLKNCGTPPVGRVSVPAGPWLMLNEFQEEAQMPVADEKPR